jgi:hypothetical protein
MHRSLLVAVMLALGVTAAAQQASIQFDGRIFKVAGARPAGTLVVYAGSGDVPPLAGTQTIENGTLIFRPTYPVAAGVRYRVVFTPSAGAAVEKTFDGPSRTTAPHARVERVYPSAGVLPSNQLRLYIYFSAPMSRGEAEQRIHVLDATGKVLRGIFLPGQELWDPQNQRLTMTFDPGRIKRDLTSNRAMGPPIAEGKRYTLLIDREWRDANGVPMIEPFRKVFRGGPAVRQPPDPKTWKISAPAAGSRTALTISFGRPMNYPLLERMVKVAGSHGNIAGTIAVTDSESAWHLTPQQPWTAGSYRLIVDNALEDLAGNKIGQPFDIDVFDKVTERITTTTTILPFQIR